MKGKIVILLAFVFTFIIHGVALGGGGFAPPAIPTLPENITGAYVKGNFTIACDKNNPNPIEISVYYVHVVLKWDGISAEKGIVRGIEKGKVGSIDLKKLTEREIPLDKVHLFSARIVRPSSANLCQYPEDYFMRNYWDLPSKLGVPAAFGVPQATPYIKQLKITDKDFCGDLNKQEPDAMIRGEVEILLYIPK